MSPNNEMCGSFNITFKALPQFDLRNVVFGRVCAVNSVAIAIFALLHRSSSNDDEVLCHIFETIAHTRAVPLALHSHSSLSCT